MTKEQVLAVVKRLLATVLAICYVLPLSQCTIKQEPGMAATALEETRYANKLVHQAWDQLATDPLNSVAVFGAVVIVFFLPLLSLSLRARVQAVVQILAAGPALYCLFNWVLAFAHRPRFGGLLAIACWVLLFCLACIILIQTRRKNPHA